MNAVPTPATLVPHAGSMCLLDSIASWDEQRVSCVSASHRRPDHPLRRDERLPALVTPGESAGAPVKYLVAARDLQLHVTRIDDLPGDLQVVAERLMAMGDGVIYGFRVTAGDRLLAEGRLTVAAPGGSPS